MTRGNRSPCSGLVIVLVLGLSTVLFVPDLLSQAGFHTGAKSSPSVPYMLQADHCPRVADPKLPNGEVPIRFFLAPRDGEYNLRAWVTQGQEEIRELFEGIRFGSTTPLTLYWDGRDRSGRFVSPGKYDLHVLASWESRVHQIKYSVDLVRLGITAISAQPSEGLNEWQMVYFLKNGLYRFYATPAIHEYRNTSPEGEVSALDLDDGAPRPPVPVHEATDAPIVTGGDYETRCYNYPVCYLKGANPCFKVTMGATCTSREGEAVPCGYPLPGLEIRGLARDGEGLWKSEAEKIAPGSTYRYLGRRLPIKATRTDRTVTWSWQYRKEGTLEWIDIPGALETRHRFYTIVGPPYWRQGESGVMYKGPWVEVAEYLYTFSEALGIDTSSETGVVRALIRGYFGQEGPLNTAIEGVIYDTFVMGGDGGATHYYNWTKGSSMLSRLLNGHDLGLFLNCTDVAASTSVMLGMLGVQKVQMVYLGFMNLRALWGIGCPGYTLNLWGGEYQHGFSYHHIITRDQGVHVSDACMWLDEDGDPDSLPGLPGYNHDRIWTGPFGYDTLSATNLVYKELDHLPYIR